MRIPGKKTAVQIKRWVSSRKQHRSLILGYHRVASVENDVYGICVSPDHFAEQMEVLKRHYRPISLAEMVKGLISGALPHKTVAVTFDDGYRDNLYNAKPILARFEIPATVFVTPGSLGNEFWWDQLESVIFAPPHIASSITLPLGDTLFTWAGTDRRDFLKRLYQRLLPESMETRYQVIEAVRALSNHPSYERPEYRALHASEINDLASDGLVDIGAHTITHPVLPLLPAVQQRAEIEQSKNHLQQILGKPVTGFAYPNGHFDAATKAIVAETGFQYACSSQRDVVWRMGDRYQLPRFWSYDADGDRLARDLRLWLG